MFVYFSAEPGGNKDFRGPDFFLVNGVRSLRLRQYWVDLATKTGRFPISSSN